MTLTPDLCTTLVYTSICAGQPVICIWRLRLYAEFNLVANWRKTVRVDFPKVSVSM